MAACIKCGIKKTIKRKDGRRKCKHCGLAPLPTKIDR